MLKKDEKAISSKQLLRYQVVSTVRALMAGGMKRGDAIRIAAGQAHVDESGVLRRYCKRTVHRWLSAFETNGINGLKDVEREKCETSTVLEPAFLKYVKLEKEKDPPASIPELIRRAREAGVLHPCTHVDRTTLWRALRRMDVETGRVRACVPDDMRRFAYSDRMQMVLVDFKHFRAGPKRARRLAVYFLDDATRFGLGVLVGTKGELTEYCLHALHELLSRYGIMDAVYWDRGPAFKSDDAALVMIQLGIPAIQGRAGYPEGHGKIEKFNQGVKSRLLRSLDGAADIDPDPGALTLRLKHDLFEVYNHLPHESLDKETPHARWSRSERALTPVESGEWLSQAFTLPLERTVSRDHIISYEGIAYEVPTGLKSRKVTIHRALLENDALYLDYQGGRIRLHPVDLAFNAVSGRGKKPAPAVKPLETNPPKTASTLSYEREYGSILDSDGGFTDATGPDSIVNKEEQDE